MKNTATCPKCGKKDIVRVDGMNGFSSNWHAIRMGMMSANSIPVTRYVCVNCGYVEEWIDVLEDREKIKERFGVKD